MCHRTSRSSPLPEIRPYCGRNEHIIASRNRRIRKRSYAKAVPRLQPERASDADKLFTGY
ncbi:hypothetical protein K458DRAFT_114618 [Lentithecium fluviatile CBS 122367]|uniref:Uncharacterized protein n=1 Tax=Lentithecium fluviatile CBS 122367 TaxID=1168545 RepID=A0A6G1IN77_9PLEO|nr:hypothetical protein K458DRAFT_114618 [Lentithecium fluviatile CBS 122367]